MLRRRERFAHAVHVGVTATAQLKDGCIACGADSQRPEVRSSIAFAGSLVVVRMTSSRRMPSARNFDTSREGRRPGRRHKAMHVAGDHVGQEALLEHCARGLEMRANPCRGRCRRRRPRSCRLARPARIRPSPSIGAFGKGLKQWVRTSPRPKTGDRPRCDPAAGSR